MRAAQIMTQPVITVGPDTSIVEAARTMLQHHISALPVTNAEGSLIGIISEGDFIRRAELGTQRKPGRWLKCLVGPGKSASGFVHEHGRKVRDVMTLDPVVISEQTSLEEIVRSMESGNIHHLPVMRGTGLVGMVTRSNLLQAVADFARDVAEPTANDDQLRERILAAIGSADWSPCRLTVMVRNGNVTIGGFITDERHRRAAIVAAENISGVKSVLDHLCMVPPPEEDLGGGDFASLQEQPSTTDDEPL